MPGVGKTMKTMNGKDVDTCLLSMGQGVFTPSSNFYTMFQSDKVSDADMPPHGTEPNCREWPSLGCIHLG